MSQNSSNLCPTPRSYHCKVCSTSMIDTTMSTEDVVFLEAECLKCGTLIDSEQLYEYVKSIQTTGE